jgi:RNA polymerase sigma-70 factor, ECF subfamily
MPGNDGAGGLCPTLPGRGRVESLRRQAAARQKGRERVNDREAIANEIPRLRRYARALMRDRTRADDLVQDCVERALSRLHLYTTGTNLRAWLFTIMHGLYVNGIRREGRAADRAPLGPDAERRHTAAPEQGNGLMVRDLSEALDRLTPEQRETILLVALEGLTYGEAADATGVAIGTVMSRLARGRARLRTLMDGEGQSR